LKVLMIEPGKAPYEAELDGSLKSMQEAVGGGIKGYYPYTEPVAIVCNDEGKINGLPLNRAIYNEDGEMIEIMAGTFFMAGLGEESFTDLPDYFMEQYKEQFKYPEKFFRLAGEIVAVKQPLPPEEKQQPAPIMEEADGDDARLAESTDLAFDLDEFFRQNNRAYADLYPDSHAEKERMANELLSGDTGKIRMRLAAFEREEHMEGEAAPLLARISSYEKSMGLAHIPFTSLTYRTIQIISVLCLWIGCRVRGFPWTGIITRWSIQSEKKGASRHRAVKPNNRQPRGIFQIREIPFSRPKKGATY